NVFYRKIAFFADIAYLLKALPSFLHEEKIITGWSEVKMASPILEVVGILLLGLPVIFLILGRRRWIQSTNKAEEIERLERAINRLLNLDVSKK
ncbi:MAG: hypothetical protein ACFFBD_22795, partial [Candidatus Hodarchaeota archaeon]